MSDLPEGRQLESRLPDDPAYWDDLAARIVDSAEPILRGHRDARPWWHPLARWSPAIAVTAAAAALLLAVVLPPDRPRQAPIAFEMLLSPEDPLARAVLGRDPVTDISAMLLAETEVSDE